MPDLKLFCGQSNAVLAAAVGCELARFTDHDGEVPCVASSFNDGEPKVEFPTSLRGFDVFVIQSTHQPGDHVLELLTMLDAASRSDAEKLTAVIPYFGFGRQDRRVKPRTPITAAMVANLIFAAGAHRIVTTDLHAAQIQGFGPCPPRPFDNLEALPLLLRQIRKHLGLDFADVAFVSPDDGGVERCRETGKLVGCQRVTFCLKSHAEDGSTILHAIRDPEIVRGRTALLIDDMVDTAGSLRNAAVALREAGAERVIVAVVHPVLSIDARTRECAYERLVTSPIDHCYFTDTIPFSQRQALENATRFNLRNPARTVAPERVCEWFTRLTAKTTIVSAAPLFAGAINEIHARGSVSGIFDRTVAQITED